MASGMSDEMMDRFEDSFDEFVDRWTAVEGFDLYLGTAVLHAAISNLMIDLVGEKRTFDLLEGALKNMRNRRE